MGERNPPIAIYADILYSLSWAAVLVKYTLSTLYVVFICATESSSTLSMKGRWEIQYKNVQFRLQKWNPASLIIKQN
jgi:hypothetical protein